MRIFFASDLHGSNRCFRKFLNAAAFYKADWLIMGGDAAGKHLVPIVRESSAWRASFQGANFEATTEEELVTLEGRLADHGAYSVRTDREFVAQLQASHELVEDTLRDLIVSRAWDWVQLARDRIGASTRLVMGLGNDDFDELAPIFNEGPMISPPDGITEIDGFWLGSVGWSNPTPWHTNREKPESELRLLMEALETGDRAQTIWNIHVPPYGSGLDVAPRLGDDLRVELVAGAPDLIPVGSTAVAEGLRQYQPLLSLHGHIHESRGVVKVGGSTVVNPGSEYDQGSLLGAVIQVRPGKVEQCQLVVA